MCVLLCAPSVLQRYVHRLWCPVFYCTVDQLSSGLVEGSARGCKIRLRDRGHCVNNSTARLTVGVSMVDCDSASHSQLSRVLSDRCWSTLIAASEMVQSVLAEAHEAVR